ncbi:MAG: response regulator [Deltaproteobacteria bacterium]|nr:response regulator [Deltaproteobacteria bacterium]
MDILVVDDDDFLSGVIASGMERWGHHVETSSSGKGALERLKEKGFDLVLLDIFLPDCNGNELIPRLKGVRPGLRVVAMTGYNSRELELEVRRQGVIYYMVKPFDLRVLKEILDHISNRKEVNEQRVGMGISLTEGF